MKIHDVLIEDTSAEAWDLEVVRLLLTAVSSEVALGAAQQFTGAAGSSELGSRFNAGIERAASPAETPDSRPGVLLSCTMPPARRQQLLDELALRVVLATLIPTCAVYDAMVPEAKAVEEVDAMIVRSDLVTPEVIAAAKNLKIVVRAGAGYDNIDLPAATAKGIVVMNTPGANAITTAEHAISLLLAISRHIPQAAALLIICLTSTRQCLAVAGA